MTDERIKEEFDRVINENMSISKEFKWFIAVYEPVTMSAAVGFYAGFKTAELLAKIEVLEELKRKLRPIIETDTKTDYWAGYQHAGETFESMIENKIDDLKEGNK